MSVIRTINCGMVNVFLINNSVLVDTGTKKDYNKVIKYLEKNDVKPHDIKLMILTHAHSDHMGSCKSLQKITGAKVLIHDLEYNQITCEIESDIFWTKNSSKPDKPQKPHKGAIDFDENFDADIVIDDEFDLSKFGVNGKVVHTPGHTKGSVSVLLDGGEVIIGDNLMAIIPFLPPKKPFIAHDLNKVKESIQDLIDNGSKIFYLSHGKKYSASVIQKAIDNF